MRSEYSALLSWPRLPDRDDELKDEQFDFYKEVLIHLPYAESFEELEAIMHILPHEEDPLNGSIGSFMHDIEGSHL